MEGGRLRTALEGWLSTRLYGGEAVIVPELTSPGVGAASQVWFATPRLARAPETALDELVIRQTRSDMPWYPDSDVGREFAVLRALAAATDVPVPQALAHEPDAAVLGAPFMVMRRVGGLVPEHAPVIEREGDAPAGAPSYNASGWLFDMTPDRRRAVWESGLAMLGRIARVAAAPFAFLRRAKGGAEGLEQEFTWWADYRRWAAPDMPPILPRAEDWLRRNLPACRAPGLSWGDARIGNMMFADTDCAFAIDWENASWGGPEMDLGWWLVMDQWHSSAMGVGRLHGLGTREETIAGWTRHVGRPPDSIAWHEAFAAFRLASIVERGLRLKDAHQKNAGVRATNPALAILERQLAART